MNAQNGKTGAAGRQVSGLGRMAEVRGYVAASLMQTSVAAALGLLRFKVHQLIITPLSVCVGGCMCLCFQYLLY